MTLGDRLRAVRERKGLSQRELARQAGIRPATLSELESGVRQNMNTDTAKRLARTLGVSIDYLVGTWDEEEEDDQPAPTHRAVA
jgi:transcriptional regulator with XRE-family HTH domain